VKLSDILWNYLAAGGLPLIPLVLVCFGMWAYLLRTWQLLRTALHGSLTQPSVRARALQYVAGRATDSVAGEKAFADFASAQLAALRRDIGVLAALTAAAPLLGLTGTVVGMVETFDAVQGSIAVNEAGLAGGIQRALVTTQFGLLIALPGVFGTARMKRLLNHVGYDLARCHSQYRLRDCQEVT